MAPFQKLLYIEEGREPSDRGLARALELAATLGSPLTVASTVTCTRGSRDPDLVPGAREQRQAVLAKWASRLDELLPDGDGARPDVRVVGGTAGEQALELVGRDGYDLVVKVADVADSVRPWRASRRDRELLRRSPVPVWLLDRAGTASPDTVLAAVDIGRGGPSALDRAVLRTAASLANLLGTKLHVVHAWALPGETILTSPTRGTSPRDTSRVLREARLTRQRRFEGLVSAENLPSPALELTLVDDSPHRAIRSLAWRREVDLVVVGHRGRRGLEAFLFGNVAERIVGHVPGSVLVVKEPREEPTTVAGGRAADAVAAVRPGTDVPSGAGLHA